MSNRYIISQRTPARWVPRCDLTGSPFPSRKAGKGEDDRQGITNYKVIPVRRARP